MRLQLGIILEPQGQVQFTAGSWLHTFRVSLPEPPQEMADVGCPAEHFRQLYGRHAALAECGACEERGPRPGARFPALARLVCPQFTYTREGFKLLNQTLYEEANELLDTIYFQLADAVAAGIPRTHRQEQTTPARRRKRWVGLLATGVSTIINLATRVWSHHQTKKRVQRLEDKIKGTAAALDQVTKGTAVQLGRYRSAINVATTGLTALGLRTGHVETHVLHLDRAVRELAKQQASTRSAMEQKKIFDLKVQLLRDVQIAATVQTTQMLQQYISALHAYLSAVRRLIQGELPPELIKARHVRQAVEHVQEAMLTRLPGYEVALRSLHDLYDLPVRSVAVYNGSIYVTTAIPIAPQQLSYTAYQISTFPKLAGPDGDQRYTEFVNVPEVLAVSERYFVEMTLAEFLSCRGDRTGRLCQQLHPEHDLGQETCAMAVYKDDRPLAIRLCQADYVLAAQPRDIIIPLSEGQLYVVMVADIKSWAVSCVGERPVVRDPCTNCLVDLPCLCSLRTSRSYYPAPVQECEEYSSDSLANPVKYITNLMYLSRFLTPQYLATLINNDTVGDEDLARGPPVLLDHLGPEWTPRAAGRDQRMNLDLVNVTFVAPLEEMGTTHLMGRTDPREHRNDNTRRGRRNFALAVGSLTAIVVLCILLALVYRYYGTIRRMAQFLTMAGTTAGAAAEQMVAPPAGLNQASTPPMIADENGPGMFSTCGDWIQFSLLVLALVGALNVLWQIVRMARSCARHGVRENLRVFCRKGVGIYHSEDARILIEVSSAQESVRMWLADWDGPASRYRLHPDTDLTRARPTFHVNHGCGRMFLNLNWSGIRMYDDHDKQTLPLPSGVRVGWLDRGAIKRVLMARMSVRLLVGSRDLYNAINLTQVPTSRQHSLEERSQSEPTTPDALTRARGRLSWFDYPSPAPESPRARAATADYDSFPIRARPVSRTFRSPAPPRPERGSFGTRSAEMILESVPIHPRFPDQPMQGTDSGQDRSSRESRSMTTFNTPSYDNVERGAHAAAVSVTSLM